MTLVVKPWQDRGYKMSEEQNAKYHIEIGEAIAPVIGDNARVNIDIHPPAPAPEFTRERLLAEIHSASAELRNVRYKIAGIHLERAEVSAIVEWLINAEPRERLGMLLDQPGTGKTVVMHDVLQKLEERNIPVLAIKADSLSGVAVRADLADRLGLPLSVEECVGQLAAEGPVVVLLDQLDALSLVLSRNPTTLDVMLSTLHRLTEIKGVRVFASCRTFDLHNDLRLSTLHEHRAFELNSLTDEPVNRVLDKIGIEPSRLTGDHRTLLRTPLNLDVYARVIGENPLVQAPESFRTLQELYEALWQKFIETMQEGAPPPRERTAAIYALVDIIEAQQQTVAPLAVLDTHQPAASYLEHEGLIRREKGNWLFVHQTFFDYSYARRFVAQGRSLSQEIHASPQGLFERSQVVQIMAYLRGANPTVYQRELTTLLFQQRPRIHLRLLLIGWFGSLPNPTSEEVQIARRLIHDSEDQRFFFQYIAANTHWFDVLNNGTLQELLHSDDE